MTEKLSPAETRAIGKKRAKVKEKNSRYFDRVKQIPKQEREIKHTYRDNYYFDCETFEGYQDKDNPDEKPLIIPYAIGVVTDDPTTYKVYFGDHSGKEFVEDLFTKTPVSSGELGDKIKLVAFNIDYDFHVIRPLLVSFENNPKIHYTMTDDKKFIFGDIRHKKSLIKLVDLGLGDKSKSLASYMKHISDLVYDDKGNIKDEPISSDIDFSFSKSLGEYLVKYGFTKETFKKQSIDYRKVNLHKSDDGNYYYGNSKEDGIEDKQPILLDKEAELEYLRIDVLSLPIVYQEQRLFRHTIKLLLGITNPIDDDSSITLPGFGKGLCEEFTRKYLTETLRRKVFVNDYRQECESYIGAFVGGNQDITYLDEEVFKRMYPNIPGRDEEGKFRIKSYDVNSMYPWAMRTGLPYGDLWDIPLSKNSVEWVEIHFKDGGDKDNPDPKRRLYNGKPKYAYLNNSFFGDNFSNGLIPGVSACNRVYVLRSLWELFKEMCDSHAIEVTSRYQDVFTELDGFLDKAYEIKVNANGQGPNSTVKLVKLLLNSLYGKTCEKYKVRKLCWCNTNKELAKRNPDYIEHIAALGLIKADDLPRTLRGAIRTTPRPKVFELIPKEERKRQKVKTKITSYIRVYEQAEWNKKKEDFIFRIENCGLFYLENQEKRFDRFGRDCRESILAGAYITNLSREKLLRCVKEEIDNGNVVLYCDTDSIKFIQFNKPKFVCHDSKLGAGKDEGSYAYFGHGNVQKKYWMHNPEATNPKKRWMVKTSGIPERMLKEPGKEFDLETIKVLYNNENRVLIKNGKKVKQKNDLFQLIIKETDFKFIFKDPKAPPTHILENGVLRTYE